MVNRESNFFRSRRQALGMTRRQVSLLLGVVEASVANWEAGRSLPNIAMVKRLMHVYRVDAAELVDQVSHLAHPVIPEPQHSAPAA